jgi:hypothetical protein
MKNNPHDGEDIEEERNSGGIAHDTGAQIHMLRMQGWNPSNR